MHNRDMFQHVWEYQLELHCCSSLSTFKRLLRLYPSQRCYPSVPLPSFSAFPASLPSLSLIFFLFTLVTEETAGSLQLSLHTRPTGRMDHRQGWEVKDISWQDFKSMLAFMETSRGISTEHLWPKFPFSVNFGFAEIWHLLIACILNDKRNVSISELVQDLIQLVFLMDLEMPFHILSSKTLLLFL